MHLDQMHCNMGGMTDHALPPVTKRRHAKAAGASHYYTGKPCKRGHLALRFVSTGTCIECQKIHTQAATKANPKRRAGWFAKWREKNLEDCRRKQRERYHANADAYLKRQGVYKLTNRAVLLEYAKLYAKNNPDWVRSNRNRRRARKVAAGGHHTAAEIRELYRKQNGGCPVCKASLANGYHADHIQPLSKGGSNDITNIQLLCPPCNMSKRNKDPIAFMQSRGFLL
jgi:5-methylcytosine-specific restriction endonuclease McrA